MLHFHVITLFPDSIQPYVGSSIIGRAQKNGLVQVSLYNPMDYSHPKHQGSLPQRIDDKPYGGGPGMVMRVEPIIQAVKDAVGRKRNVGYIHFKPRAEQFTTQMAATIAQEAQLVIGSIKDIVIFCGRYEGIDSRIEEMFPGRVISMGDYVLTGGELPAMSLIDCVSRQLPGVLGDEESREESRNAPGKYYTRPEVIKHKGKTYRVPEVLLEGNHAKIEEWRKNNS